MKAVLDAGALLAVERGDRVVGAILRRLNQREVPLSTSSAVVAQVWRDGRKQTQVARLLSAVSVRPLAPMDDRRTGELLAATGTADVVDAHLALTIDDGDHLLTSDREDLDRLLEVRRIAATIIDV